jgi:hypothetical protein
VFISVLAKRMDLDLVVEEHEKIDFSREYTERVCIFTAVDFDHLYGASQRGVLMLRIF